jgi:hypothetical protein
MEITKQQYYILKNYLDELWQGQTQKSKELMKYNYSIDSLSDILSDCGLL